MVFRNNPLKKEELLQNYKQRMAQIEGEHPCIETLRNNAKNYRSLHRRSKLYPNNQIVYQHLQTYYDTYRSYVYAQKKIQELESSDGMLSLDSQTEPNNSDHGQDLLSKSGNRFKESTILIQPNDHDILCGRGSGMNNSPGNIYFRELVRAHRAEYKKARRSFKLPITKRIVDLINNLNPPGRFLVRDENNEWKEYTHEHAMLKTSQALREGSSKSEKLLSQSMKQDSHTNISNLNTASNLASNLFQGSSAANTTITDSFHGSNGNYGTTLAAGTIRIEHSSRVFIPILSPRHSIQGNITIPSLPALSTLSTPDVQSRPNHLNNVCNHSLASPQIRARNIPIHRHPIHSQMYTGANININKIKNDVINVPFTMNKKRSNGDHEGAYHLHLFRSQVPSYENECRQNKSNDSGDRFEDADEDLDMSTKIFIESIQMKKRRLI